MESESVDDVEQVLYARATYGDAEKAAVNDVLEHPESLVGGDYTDQFEAAVADIFDKEYGVMINSGSSANLLAVAALNLPEGAEVITPLTTFSTTVAPLVQNDLIPVFVDVDLGTYQIETEQIGDAITEDTAALMIPSLVGNVPDLPRLREIADKHGLYLIEDSADTIGATIGGESTGTYSDVSTTSFYGSHVITAFGGGGMVCFDDKAAMQRAKKLRAWGRKSAVDEDVTIDERLETQLGDITYDSKFVFDEVGYNLLPLEASAAFGLEQLEKLDAFSERRQENFDALYEFFADYDDWFVLPEQRPDVETAWLAFPLTLTDDAPFDREEVVVHLETNDVQTRSLWTGNIVRHPGFDDIDCRIPGKMTNADYVMENAFVIGCHQSLKERDIEYIRQVFRNLFDDY